MRGTDSYFGTIHFFGSREPGGDIKAITTRDIESGQWSEPRIILKQSTDGIPKVIANKLVVLSTGEWCVHILTKMSPKWTNWHHFSAIGTKWHLNVTN